MPQQNNHKPEHDNFYIAQYFDWAQRKGSRRVELANRVLAKLGFFTRLAPPTYTGVMTNVEQRMNLYHFIAQVLAYGVPGDLVELGCNAGESSVLIRKVMDTFDAGRKFHVYDSFEGLPPKSSEDGQSVLGFEGGALKTARESLFENFRRYSLQLPEIHQGWFEDTLPTELPDEICFAYLDGDFYQSILVSLQHVYPRLSRGAICLIDDYADPSIYPDCWNELPGVKKACDEFFADKPEKVAYIYSGHYSHGYFRKL